MAITINKCNLKRAGVLSGTNHPDKIILHHPIFNGSIEQLNDMMITMGYTMIGYNYYVRKDGSVWEGRPCNVQGANCTGQNTRSIGVCCEGNFDVDVMGAAQFNALVELCKYLMQKYNIKEVGPHYRYLATSCPGKNFPVANVLNAVNSSNTTVSVSNVVTNTISHNEADSDLHYAASCAKSYGVKKIQEKLISLGFSCGSYGADGIFGNATYNAIKAFQKARGLVVDGIVGPNTYNALFGSTTVNRTAGPSVKELQEALVANGCNLVYGCDNKLGNETKNNAKKFLLLSGTSNSVLKWVQSKLNSLGFNCGTPDGKYGPNTQSGIKSFQAAYGLAVDGKFGPKSWDKLFSIM